MVLRCKKTINFFLFLRKLPFEKYDWEFADSVCLAYDFDIVHS